MDFIETFNICLSINFGADKNVHGDNFDSGNESSKWYLAKQRAQYLV